MVRFILGKLRYKLLREQKVFCIGLNKTGTTSIEKSLRRLGYRMGNQAEGEHLLKSYISRDYKPILRLCYKADAFQDAPFSFPFTYIILHEHFPEAKFILSIRDNADQWYDSVVRYHGKLFANGKVPTKEDLMKSQYRYPGFIWEAQKALYNITDNDPYDKSALIDYYNRHNADVRDYFKFNSNFLEINLSDGEAYGKMCKFLGKEPQENGFPWLNKSGQ